MKKRLILTRRRIRNLKVPLNSNSTSILVEMANLEARDLTLKALLN